VYSIILLVEYYSKLPLVALDCTEHAEICTQFGATSYPTLKYFAEEGAPEEYTLGRTEDDLVNFCEEKLQAAGTSKEDAPTKEEL